MVFLEVISSFFIESGSSYWLTRFVFLRILGFVYFIAFLSLALQVIPLIGEKGLTPANSYLRRLGNHYNSKLSAFWNNPSLFWFKLSDGLLLFLAWAGVVLSFLVMIGFANVIMLIVLWALYMSFVNIGQVWYGYGWESQLLETGFLAIFIVPLFNPLPLSSFIPPFAIIWLLLWLSFRLYMGAGLIKIRADSCWRDLTCLYYHYETQPIPNPLSPYFHFMPKWFLRFQVLFTHFVQIIVPVFLFVPGIPRVIAGVLMLGFQILLIFSGNLAFLNIITITALVAAFNDSIFTYILPSFIVEKATTAALGALPTINYAAWLFFIAVIFMSIPVVKNLFSKYQMMNTSFNQFSLVNTYGAFGSVGRKRYELVIEGSDSIKNWKAYEFKAKPTDVNRRLPIIAPYQPRIDWQIWFAAMQTPEDNPWLYNFISKLLENDKHALSLISKNPFPDSPPKHIRVEFYEYKFAPLRDKAVWKREHLRTWLPPLSKEDLKDLVRNF